MVSHRPRLPAFLALVGLTLVYSSGVARADDPDAPPPPIVYQGPAAQPVYVAPLAQQTQTTYVPQSVALSGPARINADDDDRPPPLGYTAVMRKRKGLIIGGAVTFGATYLVSAMVASIGEDTRDGGKNEVGAMWIPVAGPFVQIANTDSATAKMLLLGLGGAQAAGAIMLFYGLTSERRVFIRNDLVGSLTVTPMVAAGTSGMLLSGQF